MMTANSNIVFKGEPEQIKGFIEQQVTLCQEALATAESEAERNMITDQIAFLLKALP